MMTTNQNQPGVPFTISGTRRVVDVDAIDDVAGYAKVNGREVEVHYLDAISLRAVRALGANAAGDESPFYDAVARACPELSRDEVDRLSTSKVGVLLGIAMMGINEVEAQIPNAEGPTGETTTAETAAPTSSPPA